jgi:hypothetical protein
MMAVSAEIVDLSSVRSAVAQERHRRAHDDMRQEAGSFSDLLSRMSERFRLDPKILAVLMMARAVEFLAVNADSAPGSAEEYAKAASILKAIVQARAQNRDEAVRLLSAHVP